MKGTEAGDSSSIREANLENMAVGGEGGDTDIPAFGGNDLDILGRENLGDFRSKNYFLNIIVLCLGKGLSAITRNGSYLVINIEC